MIGCGVSKSGVQNYNYFLKVFTALFLYFENWNSLVPIKLGIILENKVRGSSSFVINGSDSEQLSWNARIMDSEDWFSLKPQNGSKEF